MTPQIITGLERVNKKQPKNIYIYTRRTRFALRMQDLHEVAVAADVRQTVFIYKFPRVMYYIECTS
jgi:hypothetical protein